MLLRASVQQRCKIEGFLLTAMMANDKNVSVLFQRTRRSRLPTMTLHRTAVFHRSPAESSVSIPVLVTHFQASWLGRENENRSHFFLFV